MLNAIIRSVMDYAFSVFLNPQKGFADSKPPKRLLRIRKRAFYIIHGRKSKYCKDCNQGWARLIDFLKVARLRLIARLLAEKLCSRLFIDC